jgi:hypothetical protein
MTSEEAYAAICAALRSSVAKYAVDGSFDEQNFGNFTIVGEGIPDGQCIICDRGQILVCNSPDGTTNCRLVVPSLHEVTQPELLEALQLGSTPSA